MTRNEKAAMGFGLFFGFLAGVVFVYVLSIWILFR